MPVPAPEGLSLFTIGEWVWVLRPDPERRAGNRFYPREYIIVSTSTHASKVRPVGQGVSNVELLNVSNDRLVPARGEESPETEDSASVQSEELTISSRSSLASVANDQDIEPLDNDDIEADEDSMNEQSEPAAQSIGSPNEGDVSPALAPRSRRPPLRFSPGGNPKQTSFDQEGYPIPQSS
ncbi:hypothetical protein FOL47_009920 [Perkinsus chesapeaki]|uniref:Uncharacterized protein n=1 Tax=Perkinsus chesapeaki TaxID=330153 RepID=A0A7J6L5U0_PERCH|nr:hypothetical protein FOL47_009920 [Perkinsus chesapeaki]